MQQEVTPQTEELRAIDMKLKTLKRDYEHYFLGSRPREPANLRAELQKTMIRLQSGTIKNTAERFRFNSLNQQFVTYKRLWDETLRKMEAGTYKRQVFKANLRDRERGLDPETPQAPPKIAEKQSSDTEDIFANYVKAAESCGQNTSGLTPAKLQGAIDKKANAIKEKLGVKDLTFRVEVVDGKVKLKARAQKAN